MSATTIPSIGMFTERDGVVDTSYRKIQRNVQPEKFVTFVHFKKNSSTVQMSNLSMGVHIEEFGVAGISMDAMFSELDEFCRFVLFHGTKQLLGVPHVSITTPCDRTEAFDLVEETFTFFKARGAPDKVCHVIKCAAAGFYKAQDNTPQQFVRVELL